LKINTYNINNDIVMNTVALQLFVRVITWIVDNNSLFY